MLVYTYKFPYLSMYVCISYVSVYNRFCTYVYLFVIACITRLRFVFENSQRKSHLVFCWFHLFVISFHSIVKVAFSLPWTAPCFQLLYLLAYLCIHKCIQIYVCIYIVQFQWLIFRFAYLPFTFTFTFTLRFLCICQLVKLKSKSEAHIYNAA